MAGAPQRVQAELVRAQIQVAQSEVPVREFQLLVSILGNLATWAALIAGLSFAGMSSLDLSTASPAAQLFIIGPAVGSGLYAIGIVLRVAIAASIAPMMVWQASGTDDVVRATARLRDEHETCLVQLRWSVGLFVFTMIATLFVQSPLSVAFSITGVALVIVYKLLRSLTNMEVQLSTCNDTEVLSSACVQLECLYFFQRNVMLHIHRRSGATLVYVFDAHGVFVARHDMGMCTLTRHERLILFCERRSEHIYSFPDEATATQWEEELRTSSVRT